VLANVVAQIGIRHGPRHTSAPLDFQLAAQLDLQASPARKTELIQIEVPARTFGERRVDPSERVFGGARAGANRFHDRDLGAALHQMIRDRCSNNPGADDDDAICVHLTIGITSPRLLNGKIEFARMERAGKALAKLKLSAAISADQLAFAAWPAAVGERIAAHACPKALVRGCLVVETDDSIWQQQLFHLRFSILAKVTELLGSGIVTDLEFRSGGGTPRRPPQSARTHSDTVSGDEADRIKDPVLRVVYKQSRGVALKKDAAKKAAG
jgi:hypothetical protein